MSSTTITSQRRTPGVYVTDSAASPFSMVGVETALPVFVGYTASATDPASGKPLHLQAVALGSMAEYVSYFGGGYDAQGAVQTGIASLHDFQAASVTVAGDGKTLASSTGHYLVASAGQGTDALARFNLYPAMQLFFSNGGGACYVISVGAYRDGAGAIRRSDLAAGLDVANATRGATMLVVPDACLLAPVTTAGTVRYADYAALACQMLAQAGALQDRMAILDLPGALDRSFSTPAGMSSQAEHFYEAIAPAASGFSYGASYGPALISSLLSVNNTGYASLCGTPASQTLMNNLLTSQALNLHPAASDGSYAAAFIAIAARIAAAFPAAGTPAAFGVSHDVTGSVPSGEQPPVNLLVSVPAPAVQAPPQSAADAQALTQYLLAALPLFGQVLQILVSQLSVMPSSGALAGVWSLNDARLGVWSAPANTALSQVIAPLVGLSEAEQAQFNVPLNGNAINIVRALGLRGNVVWGARTLDGNSLDYRYIQVRRTVIYIEQSIRAALQSFVFAANDGATWATVTAMVSAFLTQFWQAGGLMGDKASDAFTVACGVPASMSGLDVLNGDMVVNVSVQLIHPGELIELTVRQAMQGV